VQFFGARHRDQQLEPLKRLMSAILEHAVKCFQANLDARSREKRREFHEAEWWLFEAKGVGPFSFENVCEVLEVHPDYLRRTLSQWLARRLAGATTAAVRDGRPEHSAAELRRRSQRRRLVPSSTPLLR